VEHLAQLALVHTVAVQAVAGYQVQQDVSD
jgi:hypothetical protein